MSAYGKVNQRLFDNGWSGLLSRSEAIDSLFKAQEHELERLREKQDRAHWYISRLENFIAKKPAPGFAEAKAGYHSDLSEQPEERR